MTAEAKQTMLFKFPLSLTSMATLEISNIDSLRPEDADTLAQVFDLAISTLRRQIHTSVDNTDGGSLVARKAE